MPKHISWQEFLKVKEFIEGTIGFVILKNAAYMILNVKGNGIEIPESFRLSIYQKKSGTITVFTNCADELAQLYRGVNPWQMMKGSRKIKVQIDDAGWGSCLGGMLVGMWIEANNRYEVREISVAEFKQGKVSYLGAIANAVQDLLSDLDPESYYLELCTGWIFSKTREVLKKTRWQVLPQKIEGFLQEKLERDFRNLLVSRYGLPSDMNPENYRDAYKFALKCYNQGKFAGQFKWDPHSGKKKEVNSESEI